MNASESAESVRPCFGRRAEARLARGKPPLSVSLESNRARWGRWPGVAAGGWRSESQPGCD